MSPKHIMKAQKLLGLSPAAMTDALGISFETFSQWQSGRQPMPTKVARCVELLLLHPKTARRLADKRSEIGPPGVVRRLVEAAPTRASDVDELALSQPGIYAIFADEPMALGPHFGRLLQRKRTCLLYIGIASKSLRTRLTKQDLHGKGRSTFIQSIGAIWGYRPPTGSLGATSANYRFDGLATGEIVEKINRHMHVRWIMDLRGTSLEAAEILAIRQFKPILNIRHNPEHSPELKELRAECRRIARLSRES